MYLMLGVFGSIALAFFGVVLLRRVYLNVRDARGSQHRIVVWVTILQLVLGFVLVCVPGILLYVANRQVQIEQVTAEAGVEALNHMQRRDFVQKLHGWSMNAKVDNSAIQAYRNIAEKIGRNGTGVSGTSRVEESEKRLLEGLEVFVTAEVYRKATASPESFTAFLDDLFGVDLYAEQELSPDTWIYPTDNGSRVTVSVRDGHLKVSAVDRSDRDRIP